MTVHRLHFVLIGVSLLLSSGCTQVRSVERAPTSRYTFSSVNQEVEGRSVAITLRDQRTMASTALRVTPDSTWWIDQLNGNVLQRSNEEILSIAYRRPGRGALQGAAVGALGGAAAGLAAGFALLSARDDATAATTSTHYVSVVTTFGIITGSGVGALLGARRGSKDRYVYPQPLHARRMK